MVSLAEAIAQASYGKSADPAHPDNTNADFQAGYKVGIVGSQTNTAFEWEYAARGCPDPLTPDEFASWKEWKRGYWAGTFTSLQIYKLDAT